MLLNNRSWLVLSKRRIKQKLPLLVRTEKIGDEVHALFEICPIFGTALVHTGRYAFLPGAFRAEQRIQSPLLLSFDCASTRALSAINYRFLASGKCSTFIIGRALSRIPVLALIHSTHPVLKSTMSPSLGGTIGES